MSTIPTHLEYLAADLEADAAFRDIWHHGYIGDSKPFRYAETADALAKRLSDNPSTRTLAAIRANLAHPAGARVPVPSAKAGRATLRAIGVLNPGRRSMGMSAADQVIEAARDTIAEAFHLADEYGLHPDDIHDLHDLRTSSGFPDHVEQPVRDLVCLVGNLIALATAYGWTEETVMWRAYARFEARYMAALMADPA
ncbi:hypothetical protein [Streptomyces chrestomyceticus]|uniref:hypothetical protein n=1 Tax=Streptomyces chrestomyceticus TaxID=68185 RepID=UPI003401F307